MKRTFFNLFIAIGVIMGAQTSKADLGWTLEQTEQAYGQPIDGPFGNGDGKSIYSFEAQGYTIAAGYLHGHMGMVGYQRTTYTAFFSQSVIDFLKARNCPNAQWKYVSTDGHTYWSGTVDGREMYRLKANDKGLTIVTVDYDEHNP
jgi:hypothetical protein